MNNHLFRHVLFIGPDYRNHRGGIGAVLAVYARYIRPFKFIPTYRRKSNPSRLMTFCSAILRLLWRLVTDAEIEVIHIHSASRGSFVRKSVIILISKCFRKKVVFHLHGGNFQNFFKNAGRLRWYIRFVINRCEMAVCLSPQWTKFIQSNFRVPKVVVINNMIDYVNALSTGLTPNGKLKLLFLGMVTERKGIFDLVRMFIASQDAFASKINLTIAGDGETDALRSILKSVDEDYIKYAGWVNGLKKEELLRNCDVFILPSYIEAMPVSILEAMAYGKPIIATMAGGIPEIVKPGVNGWLFDAGDMDVLQKILQDILCHRHLLTAYGCNSFELATTCFPDAVMNELKMAYLPLLSKKHVVKNQVT